LVIFLGQAGTSIYGAYEVLVSMGIVSCFIPYLMTFAALIRLQKEPAGSDVMRIPGGRKAAIFVGVLGATTTLVTIVLSLAPSSDEPHPFLAAAKVIGLTLVLIAAGVGAYYLGRKRHLFAMEAGSRGSATIES